MGRGGAERAAGASERRAHRPGAVVRAVGELRAHRRALRARQSHRLPRRRRHVRRDVRCGAGGGLPRLLRRPALCAGHAKGARMARVILPLVSLVILLMGWAAVAYSGLVTPFMLPKPGVVALRMWNDLATGEL